MMLDWVYPFFLKLPVFALIMIPFLHWLADYVSQYNLVNLKEWYLFNSNNWSKCAEIIPV